MSRRIEYQQGQVIGSVIYLKDVESDNKGRKALFKCHCGNEFNTIISYVKQGKTTSCGCLSSRNTFNSNNRARSIKHGLEQHPLYKRFNHMMNRCYKPSNNRYYAYGARGIKVELFLQDIHNYVSYIESLDNAYREGFSIDREDNDKDYQRGNLRWASHIAQANNKSNNNKYPGIQKHKYTYGTYLNYKGKRYSAGYYKTLKQAVEGRNKFIVDNNFPHELQIFDN